MWEQIRSNRRKSLVLVVAMGLLLGVLGASIGLALAPPRNLDLPWRGRVQAPAERPVADWARRVQGPGETPFASDYAGAVVGLGASMALWAVWALVAFYGGDRILMSVARGRRIGKSDSPQLVNIVEEMAIAAGLPQPPGVYVVDDPAINAFATGRNPRCAAIAVTSGALGRLNRDQMQGVVAHEMSHILNRDTLLITMAGILVGSVSLLAEAFLRAVRFGNFGGGRRSRGGSGGAGGQAAVAFLVVAILLSVLAPIFAQLLYFALSRRREYLADASAAMLTRYPEGLASALEVIAGDTRALAGAQRVTAPMYISNPLDPGSESSFSSTHPPVRRRIAVLRGMGTSVSFADYQRALESAGERRGVGLPASAVGDGARHGVRAASPGGGQPVEPLMQARDALDLVRKTAGFTFLACSCGMRIKLPAGVLADSETAALTCPRCGKSIAMPEAQAALVALATVGGAAGALAVPPAAGQAVPPPASEPEMRVRLQSKGWTTVRCICGKTVNVSPAVLTDRVSCPACQRTIHVERSGAAGGLAS